MPNGSIITYIGTWRAGWFTGSAEEIVSAVSAGMISSGLAIRTRQIRGPSIFRLPGAFSFEVELQVQVENGMGFGRLEDIVSIIRHHVYQATGEFPSAESVPFVQQPGGRVTGTGQPRPPTPPESSGIGSWFDSLTQKGLWTFGLLGVGILAAFLLIALAPIRRPA